MSDWLDNYLNLDSGTGALSEGNVWPGWDYGADDAQNLLNVYGEQGNLDKDYVVDERGRVIDSAGNVVSGPSNASTGTNTGFNWSKLGSGLASLLSNPALLAALLPGIASYMDRQRPSGGGTTQAYAGYKPLTRTMGQGRYGPVARYAADGGLMQGYAKGGPVAMEHGGFVMTKKAVDGAGGPQGIQQVVPGARMIRGPGTGTSDSIPAYIQGPNGRTPAALSNGEAYVPKRAVQNAGGARELYSLMNKLQRRA